jgi:hypothetical protein
VAAEELQLLELQAVLVQHLHYLALLQVAATYLLQLVQLLAHRELHKRMQVEQAQLILQLAVVDQAVLVQVLLAVQVLTQLTALLSQLGLPLHLPEYLADSQAVVVEQVTLPMALVEQVVVVMVVAQRHGLERLSLKAVQLTQVLVVVVCVEMMSIPQVQAVPVSFLFVTLKHRLVDNGTLGRN